MRRAIAPHTIQVMDGRGAMWRLMGVMAALAAGALTATPVASAATGLLRPSTTRPLSGVPCSVTAYGLAFAPSGAGGSMQYGGGLSCAGGVGQKTLDVVPQVSKLVNGRRLWYDLSLVGVYQGPTPANPLRLTGSTSFTAGHVYRLLVYGGVRMSNGREVSATVCSSCGGTAGPGPSLSISGGHYYGPQTPVTVALRGTPCVVTEIGPEFTVVNGTYVNSYSGDTTCGASIPSAQVSLTLCAQVSNRVNGRNVWYTIAGSCVATQRSVDGAAELFTARTAYLGHGYRIRAATTITLTSGGRRTAHSATAYSRGWAP